MGVPSVWASPPRRDENPQGVLGCIGQSLAHAVVLSLTLSAFKIDFNLLLWKILKHTKNRENTYPHVLITCDKSHFTDPLLEYFNTNCICHMCL